jgi:hypothetical protein
MEHGDWGHTNGVPDGKRIEKADVVGTCKTNVRHITEEASTNSWQWKLTMKELYYNRK